MLLDRPTRADSKSAFIKPAVNYIIILIFLHQMAIITEENWKEHRYGEATRIFSVDALVQYTRGFTRFSDDHFGKVMRITNTGNIYVARMDLKEVARDCDQGGGWIEYDPKRAKSLEDTIRFLPRLDIHQDWKEKKWHLSYSISWSGPKEDREHFSNMGNFNLRPLGVNKKGRVRATLDGCL
jgi:hypothetical protein